MKRYVLFVCLLLSGLARVYAQSIAPFQKGDRIAFVGNSITCGGHYHSYIWLYYMTRFPDQRIDIFNEGVGGDVAEMIYQRLDKVFEHEPTVVTLSFGMNDVGYMDFRKPGADTIARNRVEKACRDYALIEEVYKKYPEVRKILIGSSPYDETSRFNKVAFPGKNTQILKIVDFLNARARENQWGFVDFNRPMVAINQWEQAADSMYTLCGKDRIHPSTDGHLVMAYLFLKAQGFAGKDVANMEINANKKQAVKAEGCTISNIKKIGKDISFDYLAEALPYPLDTIARGWGSKKSQAEVIKEVPFMEEMNTELLKVTGLKGQYKLLIDDQEIGTWDAADLAKGINLAAESKTPQYQQALTIMHLNEYRWELERTFREYAWCQFGFFQQKGLLFANDRKAIEVMDENVEKNMWLKGRRDLYSKMMFKEIRDAREQEMDVLISKIYEINKPVVRKIVLRKI